MVKGANDWKHHKPGPTDETAEELFKYLFKQQQQQKTIETFARNKSGLLFPMNVSVGREYVL